MPAEFDPYRRWLGIPPEDQPPNHYRILNVGLFEADSDVIEEAADRQMAHVQRHKLGQYAALSQKVLNELTAAKLCLLEPDRKAKYDRALRSKLASAVSAPPAPSTSAPSAATPTAPASAPAAPRAVRPQPVREPVGEAFDLASAAPRSSSRSRKAKRSGNQPILIAGAVGAGICLVTIAGFLATRHASTKPVTQKSPAPPTNNEEKIPPVEKESASKAPSSEQVETAETAPAVSIESEKIASLKEPVAEGDVPLAAPPTAEVIDLLPKIMINASATGKWRRTRQGIQMLSSHSDSHFLCITVPYGPPPEYRIEMVVVPQPGAHVGVGIIAGDSQGIAAFDGFDGETTGLHSLRDEDAVRDSAAFHKGRSLVTGQPNRVSVTVLNDAIQLAVEGETLVDWHGPFERLEIPSVHSVPDTRALFLSGNGKTTYLVRSLKLIPLSGHGEDRSVPGVAPPLVARVEPDPEMPADQPPVMPRPMVQPPTVVSSRPGSVSKVAAVPSKSEVDEATKLIREVFADDFKQAKKPADRLALAEKLLKQSSESQGETERYALLLEARSLAAAGGSPALAIQIIGETGNRFAIDATHETADLIEQLSKDSLPAAVRKELAETLLPIADDAVAHSDYDTARRLLAAAAQSARKTNDNALVKQIATRSQEVGDAKKLHDAYRKALAKLADSADDPAANLAAGKYLCFVKQDWEQGLAHLAKGSDAAMQEIAGLELKKPNSAEEQVKLADLWWALLEGAKGKEKNEYAQRCDKWYSSALPGLKGLSQTKVTKRIEELASLTKPVPSTPAAGPKPIASTGGAMSAPKSIAARAKAAIKKDSLVRSQVAGGGVGTGYSEVPPAGAVLAGLNITFRGPNSYLTSVQGLYLGPKGIVPGETAGNASGEPATLVAKKGYAVAGIRVSASYDIYGMQLIFAKLTDKGLNLSDQYTSEWIGGSDYSMRTVGEKSGQPAVGIFGTGNPNGVTGVGLVQLPAE